VAGSCGSPGQTSVVAEPPTGQTSVATQPPSAEPEPQQRACKSLRRKLSFSRQRLAAAVHEVSRERLSQRITSLRQMIKARGCT
jgi:hypothetical protein